MFKPKLSSALLLSVALMGSVVHAAGAPDHEQTMRQAMQEAVWPGDILKAAQRYEAAFPQGAWADAARSLKERAQRSLKDLGRSDISLYPSAVSGINASSEVGVLARQALMGDGRAAHELARQAAKQHSGRYVGWLQWATALGNDQAAYELALHFRKLDQPLLASKYEAHAVALGYQVPLALDHLRR